jgi:hypothetical protein
MAVTENDDYKIIIQAVDCRFKELYENKLMEFPDREKNDFIKLSYYKRFIEIKELQQNWWEPYLKTKYYLKELVIEGRTQGIGVEDINKHEDEVLYDWLKVCINPEKDPNFDFYFQKETLSKEEEVKKILFDKGKLRERFDKNEWQIRLRRIRTWFLKRYNWTAAILLHRNIKNKGMFEIFDLVFLRLLCGILVGFLPLFSLPDIWKLPVDLNISIPITLAVLVLIYFNYECYKTVGSDIDSISIFFKRVIPIFIYGIFLSLFFSYIFYSVLSSHFIDFESVICKEIYPLKIIPFFAMVALSIGIIIQIIWEDKTITEPL